MGNQAAQLSVPVSLLHQKGSNVGTKVLNVTTRQGPLTPMLNGIVWTE